MAKTQLFARVQRLFREQRAARFHGISVADLRELCARHRGQEPIVDPKRRALLASAGALVAATLAPRPLRAGSREPRERIAIVGAGIAGLNCALELADRGIHATVYEASGRVGGRMSSNRGEFWDDDHVSEWGGEFIDTGHATMRRLARRFGLKLDDVNAAVPADATDTYFFGGVYYTQAEADRDFAGIYDRVQEDLEAAPFPTTFDEFTPEAQELDRMSVYDWIESRVPGGHLSQLGQLLDVAYAIEYAADTTDQSALNILYLLGFQPDESGQTLSLFGESDERFHIRGGNDRLPQAIAHHLGEDAIKLGMQLERIKRSSDGAYELAFGTGGRVRDVRADVVVLALPFAVLRGLDFAQAGFDALKQRAIRQLGRGHSGKLQLQFRSRLWNQSGPWGISTGGSDVDTGYQESWEVTRAQAGTSGILNFFSGGSITDAMLSKQAFATQSSHLVVTDARRALKQAELVFPGVTDQWNGKATQSLWHFNPLAQLSYSYYRVGQYTSFGGYEKARQGGVLFCGEHTSTDFQGFMEGGASEGKRAARQIAKMILGKEVAHD
jgi:monoamine oxidase